MKVICSKCNETCTREESENEYIYTCPKCHCQLFYNGRGFRSCEVLDDTIRDIAIGESRGIKLLPRCEFIIEYEIENSKRGGEK